MSPLYFASIVVIIFIATTIIAFAKRGPTNFKVYAGDPNSFGLIPILLCFSASTIGGGMFLVVGQIGYEAGLVGFAYVAALVVSYLMATVIAGPMRTALKKHGATTLVELMQACFSKRVCTLFALTGWVMTFFLLAGQFVGLYSFCSYLSAKITPSYVPWALASLVVGGLMLYPIIGGLRKDILTDTVQAVIVITAVIILFTQLLNANVADVVLTQSLAESLAVPNYGAAFGIGVLIFAPFMTFIQMDVWQRVGAAKTTSIARIGTFACAIMSAIAATTFMAGGIFAKNLNVAAPQFATLAVIEYAIHNPLVLSLIFGAFFSAVLAAADTYLNICTLFGSRIIFAKLWQGFKTNKKRDHQLVMRTRYLGIVMAVGALGIAYISKSFVNLAVGALSLYLIFLPLIFGIFFKKLRTEMGAFLGPLTGLIIFLPLFFFWQPKLAFIPGVVAAILVYFICLAVQKKPKAAPSR